MSYFRLHFRYILSLQIKLHREIISRPNLVSGFGFYLIYLDLLRSALDLSLSAPTGSAFNQIQPKASFLIAI